MIETNVMTAHCDRCGALLVERIDKDELDGRVGYIYENDEGALLFERGGGVVDFYQLSLNGEWKELCCDCAGEFEEIKRLEDEAAALEVEFLSGLAGEPELTLDNSGQLLYDMDIEQEPES